MSIENELGILIFTLNETQTKEEKKTAKTKYLGIYNIRFNEVRMYVL